MTFSDFHPLVTAAWYLSVLILVTAVGHPVLSVGAILFMGLYSLHLTDAKEKKDDLFFYPLLFLLVAVTNPLFSHKGRTPLFFLNDNPVTLEAILYGASFALTLIAVLLICKCMTKDSSAERFTALIGRFLPKTATVLSVALRYVPLLKRRAGEIREAQRGIGLVSGESLTDRVVLTAKNYSSLIGWSMVSAAESARSMRARNYGVTKRTSLDPFRFTARDAGMLILIALCLAVTVTGGITGALGFDFYPALAVKTGAMTAVSLAGGLLLAALPMLTEGWGWMKWRILRSKI